MSSLGIGVSMKESCMGEEPRSPEGDSSYHGDGMPFIPAPAERQSSSGRRKHERSLRFVEPDQRGLADGADVDAEDEHGDQPASPGTDTNTNKMNASAADVDKQSPSSSSSSPLASTRRSFSQYVRDAHRKLKLRGLNSISEGHRLHEMASCIMKGLEATRADCQWEVDVNTLHPDDYKVILEYTVATDNSNKEIEFKSYAPRAFKVLQDSLGLSSKKFYTSLTDASFLQYVSNSRNGQTFFLCRDKRFFLKTENERDARLLLRLLPAYIHHLQAFPHSLLVRILGLHYVKIPGRKGKFFSVMQNVFYPEERIYGRYDLKGCILNRYVTPEGEDSHYISIMKDVNFGNQKLQLGESLRSWFLNQLDADVTFLQSFNIMDYSALVGQQILHSTEKTDQEDLADFVLRVRKSIPHTTTGDEDDESRYHQSMSRSTVSSQDHPTNLPGTVNLNVEENVDQSVETVDVNNGARYNTNRKGSGDLNTDPADLPLGRVHRDSRNDKLKAVFRQNNRRLLSVRAQNAVHVLDGDELRYFVGIIDILGQYTWKKKFETLFKSCIAPRTPFSSVNSAKYARRFKKYVAEHTE